MKQIAGRNALVTGAAGGIGRAISLALAAQGAKLWLTDINEPGLAETARLVREAGAQAVTDICDLSDPAAITAAVQRLRDEWGGLHILVNNAGICFYGRVQHMTFDHWRRLLEVNLHAPIQLVTELLPVLMEQDEAHIVNIASVFGLVPYRRIAAYQTSKYGLVGFSEALRNELAGTTIGVSAICPGFVEGTQLYGESQILDPKAPKSRPGRWTQTTLDKAAATTVRAIRRNRGVVVWGWFWQFMWRLKRFAYGPMDLYAQWGWGMAPRRKRKRAVRQESGGA